MKCYKEVYSIDVGITKGLILNIYVSFLLIKYKEAFINDTGLKQTFYILDRKEDKLCVV